MYVNRNTASIRYGNDQKHKVSEMDSRIYLDSGGEQAEGATAVRPPDQLVVQVPVKRSQEVRHRSMAHLPRQDVDP